MWGCGGGDIDCTGYNKTAASQTVFCIRMHNNFCKYYVLQNKCDINIVTEKSSNW